jgi:oligopeptide transport system permease protein
MEYNNMTNIPLDKLRFADPNRRTGDKKFDTKPMSYAKDVFIRFCKNKSSVVAAVIIVLLVLFAIFVPIFCETTYTKSLTDTNYLRYQKLLPRAELFVGTGFWDGGSKETINQNGYNTFKAIEAETGVPVITKVYKDAYKNPVSSTGEVDDTIYYDVRLDSYTKNGLMYVTLTKDQFYDIQNWQNSTGIQVIYPAVNEEATLKDENGFDVLDANGKPISLFPNASNHTNANIWYVNDDKGLPILDENGDFQPIYATTDEAKYTGPRYSAPYYTYDSLRVDGDDGSYIYAVVSTTGSGETMTTSYKVRVSLYNYFHYKYGLEPSFLFGTNAKGQDILTRLAAGARFSLILAICISAVNLFIGAMYGAVEGFYGGIVDLAMERVSDVLGGMPSMVVMSLFQLHLASKVGPVWSMVFAFILTGWLGMAGRTRMQFYRFKNQEYVLSARTLGASDGRLMFKHIFPNAMGTLITGSVLSIPGVIFSESSLTYLGIVNLESSTQTSVGTLLSNGNGVLTTFPHIILFPALFISLLEISFNLFGNGLRDAFNPSLKGIED